MKKTQPIHPLTDLDVTAQSLLPRPNTSTGFLYALLLAATCALSVLSVFFFR